jgi:molecular chaperone GrpE
MAHHSKPTQQNQPDAASATEVEREAPIPDAVLAAAEARASEAETRALRATAELQNLKRRQREEMDRLQDTASKELVINLLPVVDDLERALAASEATETSGALRDGVELTLNKLLSALRTVGVERMPGVGEPFDPNLHEAVMQMPPSTEYPNGAIAQELRSGYTQHGHVIRPSLVAVAHD